MALSLQAAAGRAGAGLDLTGRSRMPVDAVAGPLAGPLAGDALAARPEGGTHLGWRVPLGR